MRALHLIAVSESRRSLAERLTTFRTKDLYPVGHEILRAVGHRLKSEVAGPARQLLLIGEDNTNPFFLTPDDTAILTLMAAYNVQRYFMGNTNRARHVERCSRCRHVANCAIDAAAIELDGPSFEKAFSIFCTTVFHAAALKAEV
jgi:hypothetical protein